jgi:NAD(P) transhydrogenase
MPYLDYELIVIGRGPPGQRAALRAVRDRRRVALIEQQQVLGGGCLHTGTIPSNTVYAPEALSTCLSPYSAADQYGMMTPLMQMR